jgi:hypothetical protein
VAQSPVGGPEVTINQPRGRGHTLAHFRLPEAAPEEELKRNWRGTTMSTGFEPSEAYRLDFGKIDRLVNEFDLSGFLDSRNARARPDAVRLLRIYCAARPILYAVSRVPLIPWSWRLVVRALTDTLDDIFAAVIEDTSEEDEESELPIA